MEVEGKEEQFRSIKSVAIREMTAMALVQVETILTKQLEGQSNAQCD